jgi:hypothetical protein
MSAAASSNPPRERYRVAAGPDGTVDEAETAALRLAAGTEAPQIS